MDAADEHSLPPPMPPPPPPQPNRSEAYSLSSESTSSDVEGDMQPPNAARSGGTDNDDDVDADDDDDSDGGGGGGDRDDEDEDEEESDDSDDSTEAAVAATDDDCAVAGAAVSRPLSAEMYFMASRSVVIFVSFSLCASTARCGTARRSASNASLISRIRLRSRAFAVFLRYLREPRVLLLYISCVRGVKKSGEAVVRFYNLPAEGVNRII